MVATLKMIPATSEPGTARFGPYEVDSRSGEVRKFGTRIKLGEQPLRILIRLMERPGELVTREELRSLLWPDHTFVDFDHGLNSAVQRLRSTLSDPADEAQWIETVPRRGYRFAGKVEWSKENESLAAVSGRVMLAVLPFENLSGDPGQDYFSDGLTEEMIAQLGALSPEHMGVIARTTSMVYKHTSKSARQIGSELGVDYVLECGLRRDGERVRITVQLIRVRDQVHLWANRYDSHISSSIALQEEVARAVAEQIEVKLSSVYANRPTRSHPDSAANEAYLRGRFFFNHFTSAGYYKAIEYFQQAIDRDANFAEAYAGLCDCYRFLVVTDTISPSEGRPKIADSSRQAVLLGDSLAESHSAFAGALMDKYDWRGAEREFKRAMALNPSYSDTHRIYAAFLSAQLRHREAWEQISEAMRTDPLSLPNNAEVVRTLYYARDYDGALLQAQKAMQLNPDYYRTHFWMGRAYAQKHRYREAISEAKIVLGANPDSNLALTELAHSLAMAGREAEARKIQRRLAERRKTSFVPSYNLAVIHGALHENHLALQLLQQSYYEHDWALLVIACEPRLDSLRRFPSFRQLLAKVGLSA